MNVALTSGPVKLSTMEELLFPVVDFVCVPLPEIGFLALALQVTLGVVLLSRTHTFPVKLVPLSYIGHWDNRGRSGSVDQPSITIEGRRTASCSDTV